MKPSNYSKALLVLTAILVSAVTCHAQKSPSERVLGQWAKQLNGRTASFTLLSDKTYQVEFAGDEETDVWGSYAVAGDRITFKDEGGEYSSGESGEYEFSATDTSITFTKVNDPVTGRSILVEGTWTKTGDPEK